REANLMQWRPKKASPTDALPQVRKDKGRQYHPVEPEEQEGTPGKAARGPRLHKRAKTEGAHGKPTKPPKLSRLHKPAHMSLEDWQRELRRQFGREQQFTLKNLGDERIFSEFEVTNPQSKSSYRVHIRGSRPGDNFCSCPDFATNTLGTCKHIEFTLAMLERKRGGAAELRAGFQPPFSEVYLQYGARREVRFRPGTACPVEIARLAAEYFGPEGALLPQRWRRGPRGGRQVRASAGEGGRECA